MSRRLTIALDLGGVCVTLRPERAMELAGAALPRLAPVIAGYETGKIDTAGFLNEVRALTGRTESDAEILAVWNSIIDGAIPGMQELSAELLAAGHRIVVFSDTSPAHLEASRAFFPFETGVYSFEAGMCKPDGPAMFERFEALYGIPDLYVDDREVCLAAGRARRWPVYQFTDAAALRGVINPLQEQS